MSSNTRTFEGAHVSVAIPNRYDRPRVSARCQHYVHQETPDAPVSVHVRMNVDEEKMPQHYAHRRVRFFAEEIEECWHGVPHRIAVERDVHGFPNVDLAVAIPGKVCRLQDAGCNARREEFPVPSAVFFVRDLSRIIATQYPSNAFLHGLECQPVSTRRHRVPLLAVALIRLRVP